jgi:ornithine decarboxylase
LDYGVDPSKIIYANPCKQASHIRFAASRNVQMMTFDNADELYKVKQINPNAQMVLRILTDDSKSLCKFGVKFGAHAAHIPHLLRTAQQLGVNLMGVSFHVGSGCFDASAFGDAVRTAASVMEQAKKYGFEMSMLDIGGGFPCNNAPGLTFREIVSVLRPALDEYIPAHIRIIAEPGRYYVASSFTLAVNVLARRVVPRDSDAANAASADAKDLKNKNTKKAVDPNGNMSDSGDEMDVSESTDTLNGTSPKSATTLNGGDDHPAFMYYINDGMYGSFNCITFDHAKVVPRVLLKSSQFLFNQSTADEVDYPCSIWGPTCDSMDCITREGSLPEMQPGDWMYFENMGAYTMAAGSQFNGFRKPTIIYTNTFQH